MQLSRRLLLATGTGLAATAAAPSAIQAAGRKTLRLQTRMIEVNGKPATRYGVFENGKSTGLFLDEGDTFDVRLENGLDVLSGLHWHGLNPPWRQDGVPYLSAPPIARNMMSGSTWAAKSRQASHVRTCSSRFASWVCGWN